MGLKKIVIHMIYLIAMKSFYHAAYPHLTHLPEMNQNMIIILMSLGNSSTKTLRAIILLFATKL